MLRLSSRFALVSLLVVACGGDPPPPVATPGVPAEAGAAAPSAARRPVPVPVAKRPVVHEYWGSKVSDDYEWLEDPKNPEVAAFVDAENVVTRSYLDPLPERPIVKDRVTAILGATSPDYRTLRASGGTLFVLAIQPPKQQPVLITRAESGEASTEKMVLDPNVLDPSGKTAIDMFVVSPDRKLVAISLSKGGSESGDVHIFDVASGKETAGDVIPHAYGGTAGGSLAWNSDGTGFFYTRYPRTGERPDPDLDFFQQVYFHKLGTPESQDTYVIGKDFPRIAEIELDRSEDGKSILVTVANGDGGEFAHYVLKATEKGAQEGQRLATFSDALIATTWGPDGKVYGTSRKGAPRGKVLVFAPPFDKSELAVAETDGVVESVTVTKTGIYVTELAGGPSRIRRYPVGVKPEALARDTTTKKKNATPPGPATTIAPGARGPAAAELPVPAVSSVTEVRRVGEDLLIRMESFTDPPAWYRYKATEHRITKTAMAKTSPWDASDVEVLRETCSSKDGTKVPMTILRRKGIKLDGKNATILYGYGGYDISLKPRTMKWMPEWLEQHGAVAVANLRGGGELGGEWHDAGKLTKKQNVFDDYAACARTLGDLGYATADHLAGHGRSNGGLLMGAALVQHPEMFRAIVSGVGYYDMLRFELSPNGAFNVTEYGSVKVHPQFNALFVYSPYANVKDGTAYPSVLLTTGANDPRVDPYHSRKMAARLHAATSSTNPVLLRASADVGHGMGSPLSADIDETTDMLTFLFHELAVKVAPVSAR